MLTYRLGAFAVVLGCGNAELTTLRSAEGAHSHGELLNATFGGHKMEQTYLGYKDLPIGAQALKTQGWTQHKGKCDPHFGFVWTEDASGPTKRMPLKLYTTAAGQPSGVGVIMFGYGKKPLPDEQQHWASEQPLVGPPPTSDVVHVDVAFRIGDIMCSGEVSGDDIGDVLIVNPAGKAKKLPLTEDEASGDGWHPGSCFNGMGWHYFFDTKVGGGKLSWQASNLFPVVVMYHEGKINSIFFASMNNQVSIPFIASNEWEHIALTDSQMCANTCDKDCTFAGTAAWSTMHIFFNDHSQVTCPAGLKCGIPWPITGNCCHQDGNLVV